MYHTVFDRSQGALKALLLVLLFSTLDARADDCPSAAKERGEALSLPVGSSQAEDLLRRSIANCPKLSQAYYDLGRNLLAQSRLDDARGELIKAKDLADEAETSIALGNVYALQNKFEEAAESFRHASQLEPKNARALQGLAFVSDKSGDVTEAERVLRQAIELEPGNSEFHYSLALVLERLGRDDDAIVSLERSLSGKRDFVPARTRLASLLLEKGNLEDSRKHVDAALIHDPDNVELLLLSGAYHHLHEEFPEAISSYERALERDPENVQALSGLGLVLVKAGERDKGMERLKKAEKLQPESAVVLGTLGWVALQEKNFDDAKKALERALEIAPQDPAVLNNLGVYWELQGDDEKAKDFFERAKRSNETLEPVTENLERVSE
jgi:Flp pilus assembly protein TadD